MDLNYLLYRHQVCLMMASSAAGSEARSSHRRMAQAYAGRIAQVQAASDVAPMLHAV